MRTDTSGRRHSRRIVLLLLLVVAMAVPISGRGQTNTSPTPADNPLLEREFEFASGLIHKLKMPDLAEKVMDRIEMEHPHLRERVTVVRAEALIERRRFRQAEELLASVPRESPKAQAILLALADGYFMAGEREKTRAIYADFFSRFTNAVPTDPDLRRFFRDAAYKFSQMLAMANDPLAAAGMYDRILPLLGPDDREALRQLKLEQAELLLRAARGLSPGKEREALIKKARANCDEVMWGGMDLWFGRAVAALANAELIEGNENSAISLLTKNMEMLKKLDERLSEAGLISESPYAGALSLLGRIHKDRGDLLTAAREAREAEALRFLERAAGDFEQLWAMISRAAQREAAMLERAAKEKTSLTLPGTPEARQKPFVDFLENVRRLDAALADLERAGWTAGLADRKNKLRERVQKLIQAAETFDKKHGVTPQADLMLGESFEGWVQMRRGLDYLASDEKRLELALSNYADALRRFYTVFSTYPGTDWSHTAGEAIDRIKSRVKELTGKEVTIEAREGGKEKIARVVLREGHNLFGRKEYEKAAEQYLKGLNDYPEGEEPLTALGNLLECYARLKDGHSLRMTAWYLSERFRGNPIAAQAFLRVGRYFFEENHRDLYLFIYERYLEGFPEHPSAPEILFMLGEQRWKVEDYEGAVAYYRRLTERYTKTPRYLQALHRIGWAYYLRGDFPKAVEGFTQYLSEAQAGTEKAQAKLCLADAYRQMGAYADAYAHYAELTGWLDNRGGPFSTSVEALRKNEEIHQQAFFFMGHCKMMMAPSGEAGAKERQEAIAHFRRFVETYSKSSLAPSALSAMGAILLVEGRSEEAARVYEELAAQYPQSDAGQNARLAMLRSLLEIQRPEKAEEVLQEMLKEADRYPADQFLRAGLLFQDRGRHEAAVRALEMAMKRIETVSEGVKPSDVEQRALMALGQSRLHLNRPAEAAEALRRLIEQYPRSAFFFEARFLLGQALRAAGRPNEAMEALREVFTRATDQRLITRATLELAEIQLSQGDRDGALASYQRIVLLSKAEDPVIRPLFQKALYESVRLFREIGRWEDVIENANRFTSEFPQAAGAEEVRKWRSEAILRRTMGAAGS